jgi:hypothetical protein
VRNLLASLKKKGWLEWRRTGKSNAYVIRDRQRITYQIGNGVPIGPAMDCLQKDVLKDQEKEKRDLDCLPTHHKNRDAPAGDHARPSQIKQYPPLREALHRYFQEPEQEDIYPSDRVVVDVMNAAGGATEEEVIVCLRYLYNERGLRPGTRNGPRHWSWFVTAVANYFSQKRRRDDAANPCGYWDWAERNDYKLSREQFEAMLDPIEIEPHFS